MPSDSRSHRSSHKHGNRSPESEKRHQDRKRRRKQEDKQGGLNVVDDEDGAGVWIEKSLDEDVTPSIPTPASLSLNSHASQPTSATLPPSITSTTTSSSTIRDAWMLDNSGHPAPEKSSTGEIEGQSAGGGSDFFTALGTVQSSRKEKEAVAKQVVKEEPRFHRREINTRLMESEAGQEVSPSANPSRSTPGGPGSQWRMTKLRKTYELADSSQRPIEQVAVERYGSMADFEEAVYERRVLDERAGRRESRGTPGSGPGKGSSSGFGKGSSSGASTPSAGGRFMFTTDANLSNGIGGSSSRPGSRAGFRRPGEDPGGLPASDGMRTPGGAGESFLPSSNSVGGPAGRIENLRRQSSSSSFQYSSAPSTPIPSVLPPPSSAARPTGLSVSSQPPLSPSSLNKLQARVLKAKLMDAPDADELEKTYNQAVERAREASSRPTSGQHVNTENSKTGKDHHSKDQTTVEMVPTLDGMGRLYDIGKGKKAEERLPLGNRRKKPEKFETRDPKTGEMLRLNADDDTTTLGDLVRQERFGGGSADQKNLDAELARSIATDGKFDSNLDYMDENADRLARKKMKTDASKRLYAINDYARTKKALDNCQFCPQNEGDPPKAAVIAMGSRVYLACTQTEELVDGHCLIVPMQHTLTTLEGDDDVWEEIRNFMKCLIKMFAQSDRGVLFYETVLSFKHQKHTYIEAVPVPWDQWEDAPAYFKESILASETEWSQHKKLINFADRPGGFRRSLVPNLPYFMVQWDYKGEKGYGHVIEGVSDSSAKAGDGEDMGAVDEGDKGGGEFPRYFAAEIIGGMLELEPRKWRKPRRVDSRQDKARIDKFLKAGYAKYDWTGMLGRQG